MSLIWKIHYDWVKIELQHSREEREGFVLEEIAQTQERLSNAVQKPGKELEDYVQNLKQQYKIQIERHLRKE